MSISLYFIIKKISKVIFITNNKKYSNNLKEIDNKNSFPKERKHEEAIRNNSYVQNWLSSYSESQKKSRLTLIEQFCEFTEKNPTELLLEHRNDIMKENLLDIENIGKKQLLAYFNYLIGKKIKNNELNSEKFPLTSKFYETIKDKKINKEVSNNSARQYAFSKLASFFKRNNIPISFDKKEIPQHNPKGTIDKVWRNGDESRIIETKREEYLKQIRDSFPHLRDKALFLAKLSSGLDDIDLFNLKIGDFKKGIIEEFDICYINGNRIKTSMYFQTFFNSESVRMIELYLKERNDLKNDSWLFVNIKANKEGKYTKCKFNTFSESLKVVCRKLDIKNITPKRIRSYFNTTLKRAKIDFEIIERLLGHKVDISKGSAYDEMLTDEYKLAKYYSEKIEILTLLGNGNHKITEVDTRVNNLETFNENLVEKLANSNKKILELEKAITKVNEILPNLIESNEYFKNQYDTLLSKISNKDIIETLGLKENPKKTSKKLISK